MDIIVYLKDYIQKNKTAGTWIAIFTAGYLVQIFVFMLVNLLGKGEYYATFYEYISLTTGDFTPLLRPWTLFSYVFVYEVSPQGILFFIFNMLLFATFGGIFQQTIGEERLKRLLYLGTPTLALLSILVGAFGGGILITNSAILLTITAAVATLLPDHPIRLWWIPLKMKWVAILMLFSILSFCLNVPNFAWISCFLAAALGVGYIKLLQSGKDILEITWNWFESFEFAKGKKYTPHIKVVYKEDLEKKAKEEITQAEIDRILDKISEKGFANLTQAEKDTLSRFSGKRKQDV